LQLLAARSRTERELDRALERGGYLPAERDSAVSAHPRAGLHQRPVRRPGRAPARESTRETLPRLAARRLEAQGIEEGEARAAAAEAAEGAGEDELASRALDRRLRGREPADAREEAAAVPGVAGEGSPPLGGGKALGIEWEGNDEIEDG